MTTATVAEVSRAATVAQPDVRTRASIIIVGYNSWADLEPCLASLEATLSPDDEVIVVDNGSQDKTSEIIGTRYPWVEIICNSENIGFGGGNNVGAQAARGQYLAFLNPDTRVEPGWLTALIAALEDDPTAGLATSKILLMQDPERINTCGNALHISGLTLCRGAGELHTMFTQVEPVGAISGAAFAMRRELFETLGGFDERFFLYMEDTDLSLRARLRGYRCICVPDSIVYHHYTLRFGPRKTFYQERNRYLMLLKSLRGRTLLAMLPALLLAEGVTWGFALLRDRKNLGNKVQAYRWIVRHWREIREEQRNAAQSAQRVSERAVIASCVTRLAYEQTGASLWTHIAHWVGDPLFWLAQRIVLVLVRG